MMILAGIVAAALVLWLIVRRRRPRVWNCPKCGVAGEFLPATEAHFDGSVGDSYGSTFWVDGSHKMHCYACKSTLSGCVKCGHLFQMRIGGGRIRAVCSGCGQRYPTTYGAQ